MPPACRGGYEYVRARPKGNPWVIWGPGDTEPRERVWNFEVEVEVGFESFGGSEGGSGGDSGDSSDCDGDGGDDGDGDGSSESDDDEWEQGDRKWVRDLDSEVREEIEFSWWE